MKCRKCGGLAFEDEHFCAGNRCRFLKCANCGDVDFQNGTYHKKIFVRIREILARPDEDEMPEFLKLEFEEILDG